MLCVKHFQSLLESDGWVNIELFHALDAAQPDLFTPRGNVTISSLMSGTFQLVQQQLSSNERAQLKHLAEADKFYRLKAIITHNNGVELTVLTSSKAVSKSLNLKNMNCLTFLTL